MWAAIFLASRHAVFAVARLRSMLFQDSSREFRKIVVRDSDDHGCPFIADMRRIELLLPDIFWHAPRIIVYLVRSRCC